MRISHITLTLTADDINSILEDFVPDGQIRVVDIIPDAIRGQVRFLWWNIDFIAKPATGPDAEVSIDIAAHKMVPIPAAIVNRQLKEAMRDAPPGIDVIRQSLKVRLSELLRPFGIDMQVSEFEALDGRVQIAVDNTSLTQLNALLGVPKPNPVGMRPTM